MPKITKRIVDAATAAKGELFLWDDDLPGFGLRVKMQRRQVLPGAIEGNANGRVSRRLTIGRYGVLTAEEGRNRGEPGVGRGRQGLRSGREQEACPLRHDHRGALPGIPDLGGGRTDSYPPRRALKTLSTLYTDTGRINLNMSFR